MASPSVTAPRSLPMAVPREAWWTRISPRWIRLGSVVVVGVAWEVVGRLNPLFTSYPTAIVRAAVDLVADGRLQPALLTTLWGLSAGYFLAIGIGVPLGLAMARIRTLQIALDPYVAALYATPRITLIPLLVLWVGIGFQLRLVIVVLSAIFPVIINVRDGAMEVDRNYIDVARLFAASRWQILRTVVLPGSLPYVFVALRIGAQRAIIGVIVAEMTSALAGTGILLLDLAQFFRTDAVMVIILIIGFFSVLITATLRRIQDRASPWQPGSGREVKR
jgi:ABC-type nitrate/sulfonate/bicarbonate transport system permease component